MSQDARARVKYCLTQKSENWRLVCRAKKKSQAPPGGGEGEEHHHQEKK
jgi:hypothetical protein